MTLLARALAVVAVGIVIAGIVQGDWSSFLAAALCLVARGVLVAR